MGSISGQQRQHPSIIDPDSQRIGERNIQTTKCSPQNCTLEAALQKAERRKDQFQSILDSTKKKYHLSSAEADLDSFNVPPMHNVSDLLNVIGLKNQKFNEFRSRNHRIYDALRRTLTPIEVLGGIIAGVAEDVFAPSQHIFSAVMYLVNASRGVSEAYNSIEGLMEQLSFFTNRLETYVETDVSEAMMDLLTKIMVTIFEVLVIATQEVRKGRFKAFLINLVGGNDAIQDAVGRLEVLFGAERGQIVSEINKNVGRVQDTLERNHYETRTVLDNIQRNQGRLIDEVSRLEESMNTLHCHDLLHGDKLRLILQPSPYTEDLYTTFYNSTTKGTGEWIMEDPVLASWICADLPCLFLYGGPGVGKSYLTTFLISNLTQLFSQSGDKSGHNSLGYFFFRNNKPETRSVHQALRDIAAQLSDDDAYYGKYLLRHLTSSDDIKTIPSAFRKLIVEPMKSDTRQRKLFLLLDGLDEAPWEEVAELLQSMDCLKHNCNVQILMTGRPELQEPIAQVLDGGEGISGKLHYLHVTPERNRADVGAFILENIQKARNLRKASPSFRMRISREIAAKAGGLFIMATLMIADIKTKNHPASILNSVKDYPPSVPDLLHKVVVGLANTLSPEQAEDLNEMLQWVTCAEETLTLGQVRAILTLKLEYEPWGLENNLRGIYSSFFTLGRGDGLTTADLLERREQKLKNRNMSPIRDMTADDLDFSSNPDHTDLVFFHASLGDFFRSEASANMAQPGGCKIGFDENEALIHIARTCLRVFVEPSFCKDECSRIQVYAARHWKQHVTKINLGKIPTEVKAELIRYLYHMLTDEETVFNWTDFNHYNLFFDRHETLVGLQSLLGDSAALSALDKSKHEAAILWAHASASDLHAMLEPMGKIFARAWLRKDYGISKQGVHKSTKACFTIVQNIAHLQKGYTWRAENDDADISLHDKIKTALAWANQEQTWWWHLRVGSTWMNEGKMDKALHHYHTARGDPDSNDIATAARIAICYERQRRYQEALDLFLSCEKKEEELAEKGKRKYRSHHA